MKGSAMHSLYSLAWFGKTASTAGGEDPMFSGYQAAEPAGALDGEASPEETEVLAAALALRAEGEPTMEEVEWMRNRKRLQAERVMQLFNLGYSGL
jgi:hypothetical protein